MADNRRTNKAMHASGNGVRAANSAVTHAPLTAELQQPRFFRDRSTAVSDAGRNPSRCVSCQSAWVAPPDERKSELRNCGRSPPPRSRTPEARAHVCPPREPHVRTSVRAAVGRPRETGLISGLLLTVGHGHMIVLDLDNREREIRR